MRKSTRIRGQRGIRKVSRQSKLSQLNFGAEELETRRLLTAVMAPADPVVYDTSISGPLAPMPGHTFYASGYNASGNSLSQWANASAITPNTTNDLVLNVSPSSQTYSPCCEAAGGSANVLTNGITQTQTAAAPNASSPAIGDGGASDVSNNTSVITGSSGTTASFTYNLGTAPGQMPSSTGYDLSEIDIISGHQDYNDRIYAADVLVEPVGSTSFFSLSGGQGYSLISVPDGKGGTILIDKGSSQLAIRNDTGGPFATNISAVKLVIKDVDTEFREFVVTGQPSVGDSPHTPVANVVANTTGGSPVVSWTGGLGALGFTTLRSTTLNGTYSPVGSVVFQHTFVDSSAQPNSTYFYKVQTYDFAGTTSATSSAAVTTNFGATAYVFPNQLWQGTPSIIENMPQVNYIGSNRSGAFPLAPGFNGSSFSIYTTGKITTDLAGTYTFVTVSDDDGYLYVNGQLVSGNPGTHVAQNPSTTVPIVLAAHTSYNFVLLHNQTGGAFSSNLEWQEPQGDGSAGPLTLIPAINLSPTPDVAPTPTQVTAQVSSPTTITVSWNNPGDTSSYAYVVQREVVDANGNVIFPFGTIGQAFSGPTMASQPGPATWGATSYADSTASPNTRFVYRVGTIQAGQTLPTTWATSQAVALPVDTTVSLINGNLAIVAQGPNDDINVSGEGNQIVVTEGTGGTDAQVTIFSAAAAAVNSVVVTGPGTGASVLQIGGLNVTGPVMTSQFYVLGTGAITASQVSLTAVNTLEIIGPITTTGPISIDAGTGYLASYSGAPVTSNGNTIYVHAGALNLANTCNGGAGNVIYNVPITLANQALGSAISSGTVTIQQTATTTASFAFATPSTVTGTVVLECPNSTLYTTGLDTTAGNANLQINAASLLAVGAISTGAGALSLNIPNASLGGAVNAASIGISVYGRVAVDGATMTVPGNISNAGSLTVGPGGIINCAGAITGGGSLISGTPAGATVAYYRLEGTAGSAASGAGSIIDSSGNGLNGTPYNGPMYSATTPAPAVPVSGAADTTSLSFTGVGQQGVAIPDNPAFQITRSLTLEAYIFAQPLINTNQGQIVFRGDDRPGNDPYQLTYGLNGTNVVTFLVDGVNGTPVQVNATVTPGVWTHVAGVLDDITGRMSIYVNGILASSTFTTIRPPAQLTGAEPGLGIGNLPSPTGGEPFHGMIDEVRISNVALTPSQFLDAPLRPTGAAINAGSISQSSITVGPSGAVTLPHSAPVVVNTTNALNIAPGGKFDLANNTLMINYGAAVDPIASIRSYLATGFNGSAWNGSGIISSDAANNAQQTTGIGYADSVDGLVTLPPNTIELKYTLYGDTGLSGTVSFTDFMRMTQHYTTTTNATWGQGDFNYDGAVDTSDFNLLKPNYGQTLPAPAPVPQRIAPPVMTPIVVASPPTTTAPVVSAPNGSSVSSIVDSSTKKKEKSHPVKVKTHKKK